MTKHLETVDHILNEILKEVEQLKKRKEKVIVVFDLDSTLLEVGPRMTQIFRDFTKVKQHVARYGKECQVLERYTHHPEDWGVDSSLERIGLVSSSFEFYKDMMRFWKKNFFSNEYLHLDEPLPGAKHFLRELNERGANIAYLTARETDAMLEGTIETLTKHEFPLSPKNKNLILKKDPEKRDAEFKRDVIKDYLEDYASVWFFENEPVNINIVQETLPQVKLVYIDTVHSGREEPPGDIAIITDFERHG